MAATVCALRQRRLAKFILIYLIVVEAIRGRCASFTVLTATVSEIFGGQTTPSILGLVV